MALDGCTEYNVESIAKILAKQLAAAGGCVLLEPYYSFEAAVQPEQLGRLMADLQRMECSFEPPVTEEDGVLLCGRGPAQALSGYGLEFISYTRGKGILSLSFDGYEPCAHPQQVIEEIGYDAKHDLQNPSFSVFCSHGAGFPVPWQELPFIYRVHEQPPVIKINLLHDLLTRLNLPAQRLLENPQPKDFSDILEGVRGTELEPAINGQLLRTMSKAIYSEKNIGHFGLVLDNYAHFTSPIRRYPDLAIHRILSSYLAGSPKEKLKKRYGSFVPAASKNASQMEQNAMNIERDCEDCYKAEYMSGFIGQSFTGRITGVTSFGFFVELENSVEGLVSINDLPVGDYQLEEGIELKDSLSGNFYRIGQSQQVTVASVDVSAGQVNFTLA